MEPHNLLHYIAAFSRQLLILLLVMPLLVSCSQEPEESAPQPIDSKQLRLYTSVPLKLIEEIKRAFEADQPGIVIELTRSGTAKIMERVENQARTGKLEADLLWVADFSNAEELKAQGLLRQYRSPESASVYPLFRDDEHYYTGSRLLNMVVAYNTRAVKQPPVSYRELLDPRWRGRIGIVDPEVSGASMYTIATLVQDSRYGRGYLAGLAANGVRVVRNNRYMAEMIASGELDVGITIDFSVRSLRGLYSDLPIDFLYPSDGTIIVASPIAVSRDCRECEAAEVFIDWVLSVRGQTFMSQQLGIMPVRKGILPPKDMPDLGNLIVFPADPKVIMGSKQDALQAFHEMIIKTKQAHD